MRRAPNIKALSYLLVVFVFILPQKGKTQNTLNDIKFKSKDNGIIVEFDFENTISADSIYSWQSDNDWFYFTLHNVTSDTLSLMNKTSYTSPILAFQPIINDKTTQIGIRLAQRVESFELYKKNKTNSINAHLHYSLEKFNEIPIASNMNQSQREFDDSFSRSKNWMFLIGSGYVISGLVSKDEKNKNLEIGLSTIFLTYVINKVFHRT